MQVRIEDIQAFTLTAEFRSFNRAAEELNITQSALSRRLKKLEEALGARLLDRTSRVVTLTVVGGEFLPTAKRMILEFDNSLTNIRDLIEKRSGAVVVSSNMTLANAIMPEVVRRFNDVHPNIHVRLIEDSSPIVAEIVASGEAEFGLAQAAPDRPDLTFEAIIDDPVHLVTPPGHPLARHKTLNWEQLRGQTFVAMAPTSGTHRLLRNALEALDLLPKGKFEVAHMSTLLAMVGAGLGVSAVPGLGARQRPDLKLVLRPLTEPRVSRTIGIVRREGRTLSPGAHTLCEIACAVLREQSDVPAHNSKRVKRKLVTSA